ncbi:hypothetical protein QFC21_006939 [Naganishia friedmannii]|uniref:Uncharacterized protein n=1 Tax=Naganishia friedmannii TaxID=89922 RepID=A0ACC2UZE1_9TREE|nr:hypothetical protein QFC21_006939 [Naganishia friedmannii]
MGAIGQLLFAWAGTPAMFGLIAEMRRPQDFTKALLACQAVVVSLYLAVAIVVYYYCGQYVAFPALGSAGPMIEKIAYGILVGLVGALFGSILCPALESAMWFYDYAPYWSVDRTLKYRLMFASAAFVDFAGIFICGAGSYVSVVDIKTSYESNGGAAPWRCADNSGAI